MTRSTIDTRLAALNYTAEQTAISKAEFAEEIKYWSDVRAAFEEPVRETVEELLEQAHELMTKTIASIPSDVSSYAKRKIARQAREARWYTLAQMRRMVADGRTVRVDNWVFGELSPKNQTLVVGKALQRLVREGKAERTIGAGERKAEVKSWALKS